MDAQPDLRGTLARYELLMLLRSLATEGLTGRLCMASGEERVAILLEKGTPVHARSYALRHSYPAWLVRQRLLPRDTVKETWREAAEKRRPFDELLVELGHLTPASLIATRQSLARYVLTFAYSLDPASWEVRRSPGPPADLLRLDLEPDRAFFRFVAQRDTTETQAELLKDRFGRPMEPTQRNSEREAAYRAVFGARDPILDLVLQGGHTIEGLLGEGMDALQVIPRVFALHRAGMVRFATSSEGPDPWAEATADLSVASRMVARAGRRRATDDDDEALPTGSFPIIVLPDATDDSATLEIVEEDAPPPTPRVPPREAALALLAEAEQSSHYSLLGVQTTDGPASIRAAAVTVRARIEALRAEDGLDVDALSALRAVAVRVDQAERTLTDDRRRKLYNDSRGIR